MRAGGVAALAAAAAPKKITRCFFRPDRALRACAVRDEGEDTMALN
jgi:hypothetical protein